ncbi:MAG: hypothetical protein JSS47_22275, partial [Proteobacteria bacterium]|nr:hypothetical protein [Pseudomonadota bacterium]
MKTVLWIVVGAALGVMGGAAGAVAGAVLGGMVASLLAERRETGARLEVRLTALERELATLRSRSCATADSALADAAATVDIGAVS